MRLNKYISETGICSRREADAWIEAGKVTVNGSHVNIALKTCRGAFDGIFHPKTR